MSQHSAPSVHRHTLTGIGFTVLACACFSILDTGSKYAGALLPLLMALWLRYALQSALTVGLAWQDTGWRSFAPSARAFSVCAPFCFA
jgi:hypothetical protein